MKDADRAVAADLLEEAVRTGVPIAPLSAHFDMTPQDAYAVQLLLVERSRSRGRVVHGHKVGLTAKAVQAMLGVDEPDYGHLFADTIHPSGSVLPITGFLQPKVELEVSFLLGDRLSGPGVTRDDVLRATAKVVTSIEVVDSRIADWKITLADTIADNASCGAVVLGQVEVSPHELDLTSLEAELWLNETQCERGSTRDVLGDPALAIAWLANTLHEFGVALEPGHLVMPGSCTRMMSVQAGDRVVGRIQHLGEVVVEFGEGSVA